MISPFENCLFAVSKIIFALGNAFSSKFEIISVFSPKDIQKIKNYVKTVYKNKIKGFDYSSKHFEILGKNEIYVSHEYKGVYKFTIDPSISN